MKILLIKDRHIFRPGDIFYLKGLGEGMMILDKDARNLTPYMLVDLQGKVISKATSPQLCFLRYDPNIPKYLGRIKITGGGTV